jgi:hypothetical protein
MPKYLLLKHYRGTQEGGGALHILVDDEAAARSAVAHAGFEVGGERDVLVDVPDRPGSMGEVARRIGDAGVNIELVCTTFGEVRLVLGVDDIDKARVRAVVPARVAARQVGSLGGSVRVFDL